MLLLAGLLILFAFITATLSGVTLHALENEALLQSSVPEGALRDWRTARVFLAEDVRTMVDPAPTDAELDAAIDDLRARFSWWYNVHGRAASVALAPAAEADHRNGTSYDAWSVDLSTRFSGPSDGADDGVLWEEPCRENPDADRCVIGVVLRLELTDERHTVAETVLFSTT